jgi:hypothetical protein
MLLSPSSKNSILYRAANSVGSSSGLYSLFTSVPTPLCLDAPFLTNRPDTVLTTHALGVGGLRDEGGGSDHDGRDCEAVENSHLKLLCQAVSFSNATVLGFN